MSPFKPWKRGGVGVGGPVVVLVLWCQGAVWPAGAAELGLSIDGALSYGVDGNFARASSDSEPSELATGDLDLRFDRAGRRMTLDLSYGLSLEQGFAEDLPDGDQHQLRFDLAFDLGPRSRLTFEESLTVSPRVVFPREAPTAPRVAQPRSDQWTQGSVLQLDHDLSPRTDVQLTLQQSASSFEDPALQDNRSYSLEARAGVRVRERRSFTGAGGFRLMRFGSREADALFFDGSFRQQIGRRGELEVDLGGFFVQGDRFQSVVPGEGVPAEDETGLRGGLTYSFGGDRTRWKFGYDRDVTAGTGVGEAVVFDGVFSGVSYTPGRRWSVSTAGNLSRQEGLALGSTTRLLSLTASASWLIGSGLRLNGQYSWIDQTAEGASTAGLRGLSFSSYRVFFSVRIFAAGSARNTFIGNES